MTPLFANRFAGHLPEGDPRTPVHGAAGCVWPTIPPMRFRLLTEDATGIFIPLREFGALVIRQVNTPDHDDYNYIDVGWPPPWSLLNFRKIANPSTGGYRWLISITTGYECPSVDWDIALPEQRCNVTIPLGDRVCPFLPFAGSSGSTFRAEQVEYDETNPP